MFQDSIDSGPSIKIYVSKESTVYSMIIELFMTIESVTIHKKYSLKTSQELAIMLNELTIQQAVYFLNAVFLTGEYRYIFKNTREFVAIIGLLDKDKFTLFFDAERIRIICWLIKSLSDLHLIDKNINKVALDVIVSAFNKEDIRRLIHNASDFRNLLTLVKEPSNKNKITDSYDIKEIFKLIKTVQDFIDILTSVPISYKNIILSNYCHIEVSHLIENLGDIERIFQFFDLAKCQQITISMSKKKINYDCDYYVGPTGSITDEAKLQLIYSHLIANIHHVPAYVFARLLTRFSSSQLEIIFHYLPHKITSTQHLIEFLERVDYEDDISFIRLLRQLNVILPVMRDGDLSKIEATRRYPFAIIRPRIVRLIERFKQEETSRQASLAYLPRGFISPYGPGTPIIAKPAPVLPSPQMYPSPSALYRWQQFKPHM